VASLKLGKVGTKRTKAQAGENLPFNQQGYHIGCLEGIGQDGWTNMSFCPLIVGRIGHIL
jgi:hypothetical protein